MTRSPLQLCACLLAAPLMLAAPLTLAGCMSEEAVQPTKAAEPTMTNNDSNTAAGKAMRAPDPVEPTHFVIIARPAETMPLDCAIFETPEAPHRRPRKRYSDATDHPERLRAYFELIEAPQNPSEVPLEQEQLLLSSTPPAQGAVSFALGTRAFRATDAKVGAAAYDRAYCERLNALLGSTYVVLHAYPISVDWGNSSHQPWREVWAALGTDPGKANAGFDTLEQAQVYAASLLLEPVELPAQD